MATAYLCRTSRPTKVYSSPISVNPTSTVIPKGSMFISTNYHNRENLDFYEITNDEYNQNLPVGAWVAGDVIDCIPTDDFDTTNITKNSTNNEINETLFIKSNKITVFGTLKLLRPTVLIFAVVWFIIVIGFFVIGLPLGPTATAPTL